MSEAWRKLNLEGGGLQGANLKLASLLKRRGRAYGLLALFPLGLHRAYLGDRAGAWAYRVLFAAGAAAYGLGYPFLALALGTALAAFGLYDLRWIESRVATLNKALRMQVYLHQSEGAPKGFKGRFVDDAGLESDFGQKKPEPPGEGALADPASADPRRHTPSFAEQERLLRELAKSRKKQ